MLSPDPTEPGLIDGRGPRRLRDQGGGLDGPGGREGGGDAALPKVPRRPPNRADS